MHLSPRRGFVMSVVAYCAIVLGAACFAASAF